MSRLLEFLLFGPRWRTFILKIQPSSPPPCILHIYRQGIIIPWVICKKKKKRTRRKLNGELIFSSFKPHNWVDEPKRRRRLAETPSENYLNSIFLFFLTMPSIYSASRTPKHTRLCVPGSQRQQKKHGKNTFSATYPPPPPPNLTHPPPLNETW